MMMWIWGVLFSISGYASQPQNPPVVAEPAFVQIPSGCLQKSYPCALQAEKSSVLQTAGGEISISPGAQLLLISANEMQLVRGNLWAQDVNAQTLRFGSLRFEVSGDVFFERVQDRIVVRRLKGDLQIVGPTDVDIIPLGFENWYEGFNQRLQLTAGVPRAIEAEAFAKSWGLTLGRKALLPEKRQVLQSYKVLQKAAILSESEVYHNAFEKRRLAAEDEERQRKAKLAQAAAESRHYREMFRRKFFEPDGSQD